MNTFSAALLALLFSSSSFAAHYSSKVGNSLKVLDMDPALNLPMNPEVVSFVVNPKEKTLDLAFDYLKKGTHEWAHMEFNAPIDMEVTDHCGVKITSGSMTPVDQILISVQIQLVDATESICEPTGDLIHVELTVTNRASSFSPPQAHFSAAQLLPIVPGI